MSNLTKHYKDDELGIEFDYNSQWYLTEDPGNYDIMIRALHEGGPSEFEYVGILIEEKLPRSLTDEADHIFKKWYNDADNSNVRLIRDEESNIFGASLPARKIEVIGEAKGVKRKAEVYITNFKENFARIEYHGRFPDEGEIPFDVFHDEGINTIKSIKFN